MTDTAYFCCDCGGNHKPVSPCPAKRYTNMEGEKVTLYRMVRDEPEWATSRIRVGEELQTDFTLLSASHAEAVVDIATLSEQNEKLKKGIRDLRDEVGKKQSRICTLADKILMLEKDRNRMEAIGYLLHTQDNRITDAPMFVVQQSVRDWGYDSMFSDDYKWIDPENEYQEAESDEADELDRKEDLGESTGSWEKNYYKDRWEFVTACFTEQGCKDYIQQNGHNLRDTRIYAEGSYRNNEFRAVRDFLMGASTNGRKS